MKRSKFNVDETKKGKKKREYNGVIFDSQLEHDVYVRFLIPRLQSGEIASIEIQKKFLIQEGFTDKKGKKILPIFYIADFFVVYNDGKTEAIDAKGFEEPVFLLKAKLYRYRYRDIPLVCIGYSKLDGGFVDLDTIKKGRKERKRAKESGKKDENSSRKVPRRD